METIEAIAAAIRATDGATLLDVDPGKSTNRTVFTFVGAPKAVVDAAVNAAKIAKELIDMTVHKGEHPRFGAMDVCPFIPVARATMDDCVKCAQECGRRLGDLGLPIYLYEYAAKAENHHRKLLPQVRQGEYEGLEERAKNVAANPNTKALWAPDFGPLEFVPKWGATAVGARKFLIAYNVNILGTKQQAHRIALDVREQGRGPDEPGLLKAVKGIGWYVDEYDMAQVSVNLVDLDVTPMHLVFEACKERAAVLNLAVAGSEIVGVVPLEAMMEAADYYIKKENLFILEEAQKIRLVVERLGLSSVSYFDPKKKIIEKMVPAPPMPLATMPLLEFIKGVGSRSPAPGGGSVSAAVAAMGAGLGAMVGWMTYGYRSVQELDPTMRRLIPPLDKAMNDLIPLIDKDTNAFNEFMAAQRMPKNSVYEIAEREDAMQRGLQTAVRIPLTVMRTADTCWDSMLEMAKYGNFNSKSDLEVGARSLHTGIWGAYQNILINLKTISNDDFCTETKVEADKMLERAEKSMQGVFDLLDERETPDKEPRAP